MHGGRSFAVKIDKSKCSFGQEEGGGGVTSCNVVGYDEDHHEKGAVFRVPITVIQSAVLVWLDDLLN